MTIVEFYDGVSIHNMVSCLTAKPEKVIFIGERKLMLTEEAAYRRFVERKGIQVEFEFRAIHRNSLEQILSILEEIVEQEENCAFDLTGGDDLVLVAMGMTYEKYKHTGKVKIHRFNVRSGTATDCDHDGIVPVTEAPKISAEDNITLYGGCIIPRAGETGAHQWDFHKEFVEDMFQMWEICRKNPALWNAQLSAFMQVNPGFQETAKTARMAISRKALRDRKILHALQKKGLILDVRESDSDVSFVPKNQQVRECLSKAGNLLELMVTYYAKTVTDSNGVLIYNDVITGAFIDWDSEIHNMKDVVKDTTNEIDVILMKGLIPVFVSCKNGSVDQNELYKLHTVARRFGGPYAKMALISTYFGKDTGPAHDHFIQRAKDMHIRIIENVHELSGEAFMAQIKGLCT